MSLFDAALEKGFEIPVISAGSLILRIALSDERISETESQIITELQEHKTFSRFRSAPQLNAFQNRYEKF